MDCDCKHLADAAAHDTTHASTSARAGLRKYTCRLQYISTSAPRSPGSVAPWHRACAARRTVATAIRRCTCDVYSCRHAPTGALAMIMIYVRIAANAAFDSRAHRAVIHFYDGYSMYTATFIYL